MFTNRFLQWLSKQSNESKPNPNHSQSTLDTLYHLENNIRKLREDKNDPNYDLHTFKTYTSGGLPVIMGNLDLPIRTITTNSGLLATGYRIYINCRKLPDVTDLDGNDIYEADNGILFVYRYTPESFLVSEDCGMFIQPRLDFSELKEIHTTFSNTAAALFQDYPDMDELLRLKFTNRITELQKMAYQQGKYSSSDLVGSSVEKLVGLD